MNQQSDRPTIPCFGVPLDNVFREKYLGTIFTADTNQKHDVKETVTRALSRCGQLRHILDSSDLSLDIKLRLYQTAVCSILSYGCETRCETWTLDPVTMRMINGANSKMLSRFTGKTIPQEARQTTCNFNLVHHIRIRRFRLVHILRADPSRLTYQAVEEQSRLGRPGNILIDAPPHTCLMNLTVITSDTIVIKVRIGLLFVVTMMMVYYCCCYYDDDLIVNFLDSPIELGSILYFLN